MLMLIVRICLFIYKGSIKCENLDLRGVLYLMYKEYKVEMTGTREQFDVRWGNCGIFLIDKFI